MTETTSADETATALDPPRPDPVLAALQERRARLKADVAHAEVQLADLHAEQDRVTAIALEARALLDDVDTALAQLVEPRPRHVCTADIIGQAFDTQPDLHRELSERMLAGAVIRTPTGTILTGTLDVPWGAPPLPRAAFPCTVLAVW